MPVEMRPAMPAAPPHAAIAPRRLLRWRGNDRRHTGNHLISRRY
jgi:hypothetical protein